MNVTDVRTSAVGSAACGARPLCDVVDLVVGFDRFTLGPIHLRIHPGDRIALLGPNGAGKSTLLSVLGGRLIDYAGSVRLGGVEIRTAVPQIRGVIGVLPERVVAYDWMRVRDYLDLQASFIDGWDHRAAGELAGRLSVDVTAAMATLSKGTRVKVAFIAAECAAPPLLLLDEPTSGLDPIVRDALLACIRERLARDPSRALLFSTHMLEDVGALATRAIVIRDGALVAALAGDGLADARSLRESLSHALRDG